MYIADIAALLARRLQTARIALAQRSKLLPQVLILIRRIHTFFRCQN